MPPFKLMSQRDFADHIKQIVRALYAGGQAFEAKAVFKELCVAYPLIRCDYSDVVNVLEKLASEGKLACIIQGEKYKILKQVF